MYIKRDALIKTIDYLMQNFPCVALLGARQVGKSTLLHQIRPNAQFFDLESRIDFTRIANGPELIFKEHSPPYIFDEAQLYPELFKSIRIEIDRQRQQNGIFLISGSSSPQLLNNITETLAGRVAILEIPTLDWSEQSQVKQSSLYENLGHLSSLKKLTPRHTHQQIATYCLFGGYPEPFLKRDNTTIYDLWYENYYRTYLERDVKILFPNLQLSSYKRFIQMLAFSTGEIINASNFARSLDVSQPTIKKYLEIIEGTFLWRRLNSYEKSRTKRVIKMPRGHLKDTGLICYLLNIHSINALKGHPLYGRIWEGFIIEQILKGLERNLVKHSAFFYRTNNQSEIDLIIEGRFGTIPIEIKSGSSTPIKQLRTLEQFIRTNNCSFGIVINQGEEIFMLSDNIIQIPAIYL